MFIAAMLLHPGVQERAQKELDSVVGRDRLPDLSDRESLPYLQCVVNEVMRLASNRLNSTDILLTNDVVSWI